MVPKQKHASPYQRDQRGTKVQFGVVNLAAADDLGILKGVNHLVPEMVLGNPPDANKERSGDEQKEQQGFLSAPLYSGRTAQHEFGRK
jgi:hypothetical protein